MSWKLDHKALARAYKTLNIEAPVRYRLLSKFQYWGVHRTHHYNDEIIYHLIQLDKNMTLKDASGTIWHELTHAVQTERYGPLTADYMYNRQMKKIGIGPYSKVRESEAYMSAPFEAEAYANERKYQRRLLVIDVSS